MFLFFTIFLLGYCVKIVDNFYFFNGACLGECSYDCYFGNAAGILLIFLSFTLSADINFMCIFVLQNENVTLLFIV